MARAPQCLSRRIKNQHHGLGRAPVEKSQRYSGVKWVDEAALTLDDDKLRILVLQDLLLDRSRDEVADHPVDRNPAAVDHDSCLPRGHKLRAVASAVESTAKLDRGDHLAHAAIVADGMDPVAPEILRHVLADGDI